MLAYLARYTHRLAISNSRLIATDETGVTFKYKDHRIEGPDRYKTMTLAVPEFIRRFMLHVLPKGFHRIRHYGLLARGPAKAATIKQRRSGALGCLGQTRLGRPAEGLGTEREKGGTRLLRQMRTDGGGRAL